jgi:hypothetical protein
MNLFDRLKHVIYWLPVIWRDYWFDHVYLLRILRHKLDDSAEMFRRYGSTEDAPKLAEEMEVVVATLDRLIDDDYIGRDLDAWCKKWGKMICGPLEGHPGWTKFIRLENEHTPEDTAQIYTENRAMYEKHECLRQADLDLVAKAIATQLVGWWD